MRFFLQSITSLLIGGFLGFLLISFHEGLMIVGIPIPLITVAAVLLGCAAIMTKNHFEDFVFKSAFILFFFAMPMMPVIFIFSVEATGIPVQQSGFNSIVPLFRFLTMFMLVASSIASLSQIYIKNKNRQKKSVK